MERREGFICSARCLLVAHDIGPHQLERLVELLTLQECEDLLHTLSHPEENIFQHIDKLSPENNQLRTQSRAKREAASSAAGTESALVLRLLNATRQYSADEGHVECGIHRYSFIGH